MDTLLFQGDHKLDQKGFPILIDGEREKIQQALILLTMRKGAFRLAPEMGSLFHRLGSAPEAARTELALEYAQEALMGLDGVQATKASCLPGGDGWSTIQLELWLECGGTQARTQIQIS